MLVPWRVVLQVWFRSFSFPFMGDGCRVPAVNLPGCNPRWKGFGWGKVHGPYDAIYAPLKFTMELKQRAPVTKRRLLFFWNHRFFFGFIFSNFGGVYISYIYHISVSYMFGRSLMCIHDSNMYDIYIYMSYEIYTLYAV